MLIQRDCVKQFINNFIFKLQIFHRSKCVLLGIWHPVASPSATGFLEKIMHLNASDSVKVPVLGINVTRSLPAQKS